MKPAHFHDYVLEPALEYMSTLGERRYNSLEARRLLMAIAWQESRITERAQIGGPARGFFQFESGGGLAGVVSHPSTQPTAVVLFKDLCIPYPQRFLAIELNDTLACCFARLLLYTDPRPLPKGQPAYALEEQGWQYYLRNWRPGKPHRATWGDAWRIGIETTNPY